LYVAVGASGKLTTNIFSGYLPADGSVYLQSSYPDLFSKVGLLPSKKTALTVGAAARGALSIATILSQKLNGTPNIGLAGSGGGAGSTVPAQFNIVEASQNNQLAQLIGRQQQQPIQTYVVGSQISSQQALDRQRIQNSTFL
jgi:hypothetical protein